MTAVSVLSGSGLAPSYLRVKLTSRPGSGTRSPLPGCTPISVVFSRSARSSLLVCASGSISVNCGRSVKSSTPASWRVAVAPLLSVTVTSMA